MTRTSARTDTALVGSGPECFSTSTEIEVWPSIVYDANAYYATLGVTHRATRTELRQAYLARGGQKKSRMTYILKQLLDPQVRRKYDATPLGSLFLDDYVVHQVQKVMAQQASEQAAFGQESLLDFDDFIRHTALSEQNRNQPQLTSPQQQWQYSYYLKGSGSFRGRYRQFEGQHREVLRNWQTMLVTAFASRRLRVEMGVGLSASDQGVYVTRVGYRLVAFINIDESPTEALASAVASMILEIKE